MATASTVVTGTAANCTEAMEATEAMVEAMATERVATSSTLNRTGTPTTTLNTTKQATTHTILLTTRVSDHSRIACTVFHFDDSSFL